MPCNASRLGISTASYFNRMPIEDIVLDIGAHGVPRAELFLNTFSEYEDGFADLLAARTAQAGLSVYSIHPMSMQFEPLLFSLHARQRDDAMRIFEQVLRAARRLGASCYVMHGAAHLSGAAKNLQIERLAPIFTELCAMSREYGVTLTLENVSWCLFCSPEFGLRMSDLLGDALHYTLDVKQAVRSGHTPFEYIEAVGGLTENLHLCDYRRDESGAYRWTLPGQGECDFPALLSALRQKGYQGPAFVEVYSDTYGDLSELYASYHSLAAQLAPFL